MKSFKIINFILLFSLILTQASLGSEELFRRVRGEQLIPSPPGVKGEVLLRNLYALFICFQDLTAEDLTKVLPVLSSVSGSNVANHKLSEAELGEFIENIPRISGEELSFDYALYSQCYDAPTDSSTFGNFLHLFEQHFLHVLNVSGAMEPVFKLAQCLVAAEYIAGQSTHELENPAWFENAIEWHKWLLTGEFGRDAHKNVLFKYYNWENLSSEDREFVMASAYVLLGNKGTENVSILLSTLAQDPVTQDSISRVKNIIGAMFLERGLKDKVLSLFPRAEDTAIP